MTEEEIILVALRLIHDIAPEADVSHLDASARFRDQFTFDSVDFLNFVLALQHELKLVIPEIDFPQLVSLDGCVGYLTSRVNPANPP